MELIARDARALFLAEVADLTDDAADAVVLLHGFPDGSVGNVDAVIFVQGL